MGLGPAGMFFQITALFLSLVSVCVYIYSYFKKSYNLINLGNKFFIGTSVSVISASVILFMALAVSDFSIQYVVNFSNSSLPMFYKISAFWGGQAGSLLLWVLLLVLFGLIELFRIKKMDNEYKLGVMLIMAGTVLFFLVLVTFLQNPFESAYKPYIDGKGLNPILQNPGMVLHPPALYVGYVGFTVIAAHSLGAIISRNFSPDWLKMARPWSMIVWAFLTIGIVLGAWWAYVELGWGGYWAWDPVENASLMPWFTATAFLHSAYVYEKTGKLKIWTFILLIITFELTILGTFITRSGMIESVHSFTKHPIGNYFLVYILVSTIVYLAVFFTNPKFSELVKNDEEGFKLFSRNGLVFIANWLFIAISIAIIIGTLMPLFKSGTSYNLTYYNNVTAPFFAAIFFVSGLGLLTKFKITNFIQYRNQLIIALVLSFAGIIVLYSLGYRIPLSLVLNFTIFFSACAVILKTVASFQKKGKKSFLQANRFYGAMIVHFGLVIIAFGVVMSAFYKYESEYQVLPNFKLDYKEYTFQVGTHSSLQQQNYITEYVPIKIYKHGKLLSTAYPELRLYNSDSRNVYTEVSYFSEITGDLYFALKFVDRDGAMYILFIHQPFVSWIWVGCIVMAIGAIFGAFTFRKKEVTNDNKKSYLVEE